MDKKTYRQMVRGKMVPDARIDLHNMTQAQAHRALTSFVCAQFAADNRLLLVITGKGQSGADTGPIPERTKGVLRRQVPHWLALPPLDPLVLQLAPAHRSHGGGGAYYVYLRRKK